MIRRNMSESILCVCVCVCVCLHSCLRALMHADVGSFVGQRNVSVLP